MSTNEKKDNEKVMTKYDLKMQRRAQEKADDAKSLLIWEIIGVVAIIAVVALIAYFPIRAQVRLNKTLFTVGDRDIKRVEFDYMYNTVKTNYYNNYGSMLSYYGLSANSDPASVPYSDTLSFKDYFEQLTVDQIKQNVALEKEMKAAGFSYDASADYKTFIDTATEAATAAGVPVSDYLKSSFGEYATKARLKSIVEYAVELSKYFQQVVEEKSPTDAEIQEYYEKSKNNYDSVDYFLTTVSAKLPTKPTDKADEGAKVNEDGTYTPSDAEIEEAMTEAKKEADGLVDTIMTKGEAHTNELGTAVDYHLLSWLFDGSRKNGDTTVIENSSSHEYYVVGFAGRSLDETSTADIRVIISTKGNGEEIVSKYESGDKTEESFIALVDEYSEDSNKALNQGLYEGQIPAAYDGELYDWIFAEKRNAGDVKAFVVDEATTYVIYYVKEGEPAWKIDARDARTNQIMEEYVNTITEPITVSDPDEFLRYLVVEARQAAMEQESAANEGLAQ